ncbi:somatostatin-1A-like [Megalops cyprinoides]|uniref:somatostatin-1A-like n=1 Tax=Megalops cyprinoides TaxID=118141 RepID=UPI001864F13B|nr:somatostatin-1A-like [Megalops cyprinoides]
MLSPRIQCAFVLLYLALAVSSLSGALPDIRLHQLLQGSPIASAGKQDLARYTLGELLTEFARSNNEALASDDIVRGNEQEELRMEVERDTSDLLDPRARKAGCRNYFWKGPTAC